MWTLFFFRLYTFVVSFIDHRANLDIFSDLSKVMLTSFPFSGHSQYQEQQRLNFMTRFS